MRLFLLFEVYNFFKNITLFQSLTTKLDQKFCIRKKPLKLLIVITYHEAKIEYFSFLLTRYRAVILLSIT